MNVRRLAALAAAALVPALPAAAAAEPIAAPGAATSVREYRGIVVYSAFAPTPEAPETPWRLAIRRPGGQPELLPVAPGDRPFEADIGPDSAGEPQLIYQRCAETCDLFVYSLSRATGERPVRNANDPAHHDTTPTIWRGRIAWSRIYGEDIDRKVVVYTKTLTTPRSRPSTRLPGVPQRRCGDVEPVCGPTSGRTVEALELWGGNLAQSVSYGCRGCSGISQKELRLVRVSDRRARQVAFQVAGLSGQSLVGPSFFAGRLAWYRACLGDPAACQGGRAFAYRHRLSTGAYERAGGGPVAVHGFADAGTSIYRTAGCSVETTGPFNEDCRIERVPPPDYERVRAPLRGG